MLIPMRQQPQICTQASTQHPDLVDSLIFDEPTSVKAKQRSGQECSVCWIRSRNLAVVCFWAHCSSATRLWTNCWITNLAASQKDWQKTNPIKSSKKKLDNKTTVQIRTFEWLINWMNAVKIETRAKVNMTLGGETAKISLPWLRFEWVEWCHNQALKPSRKTTLIGHVHQTCHSMRCYQYGPTTKKNEPSHLTRNQFFTFNSTILQRNFCKNIETSYICGGRHDPPRPWVHAVEYKTGRPVNPWIANLVSSKTTDVWQATYQTM